MPPGTRRQHDQAIDPRLRCDLGVARAGDVVKDGATIVMYRRNDIMIRSEGGDHERNLASHCNRQIFSQPSILLADDEVHAIGGISLIQRSADLLEPALIVRRTARVQRREGSDDPCLACRDRQRRI